MEKNTMVKKVYSKPGVEFVNFSLAGSIAATCRYVGTSTDGNSCGYVENGWTFYAEGITSVCDFPIDGEFCYHVPTEDQSVFNS